MPEKIFKWMHQEKKVREWEWEREIKKERERSGDQLQDERSDFRERKYDKAKWSKWVYECVVIIIIRGHMISIRGRGR